MAAKEFLNPSSMLTPGVAGTLTMTVANTITMQFGLPHSRVAATALIISFLFGLLVLTAEAMPIWRKLAYYVVNSFVIFTVAVGSNTLGGALMAEPGQQHASLLPEQSTVFSMVGVASAQADPQTGWCCLNHKVNESTAEECSKWGGRLFASKEEALQACQVNAPARSESDNRFFVPWFQGK